LEFNNASITVAILEHQKNTMRALASAFKKIYPQEAESILAKLAKQQTAYEEFLKFLQEDKS